MQFGHLPGFYPSHFSSNPNYSTLQNANFLQLRLDFNTFVITGPNTYTILSVYTGNGGAVTTAAGLLLSPGTQCLTDSFSVTGYGSSPPVICGTNTGYHSGSHQPQVVPPQIENLNWGPFLLFQCTLMPILPATPCCSRWPRLLWEQLLLPGSGILRLVKRHGLQFNDIFNDCQFKKAN